MTQFDPAPESGSSERRWQSGTDTFDRVHDVVLGVTSPTAYTEIADLANCSPNAAKKHLDRLTEMGLVHADQDSRPPRYERHDGYLEWQEASRIATDLSVDEIVERVRDLEGQRTEYEARFDATDPRDATAFNVEGHDSVHERMVAISDWQGVIRDLRLYELARQLAENDGHLLPA